MRRSRWLSEVTQAIDSEISDLVDEQGNEVSEKEEKPISSSSQLALGDRGGPMEVEKSERLSYLFAHLDFLSSETFSFLIFFLLLFSSFTLPISAFHLSVLSEV